MACKWIYKGKVYTESQFIAVMANDLLNKPSTGQRIESWGKELEAKVDEFFKQNPTFATFIPPHIVKAALKTAAKAIITGGKTFQVIESAIKYIQDSIQEKLTEIHKTALREF